MSSFTWQIKQFIRKLLPFAIVGGILYGGYNLHQEGAFRRGVGPFVTSMLSKIPVFGSQFKRSSSHRKYPSYAYGNKSYRKGKKYHRRGKAARRRLRRR